MKKLFVLLFLMVVGTHLYAQKSYITINVTDKMNVSSGQKMVLTGDIPDDVKVYYDNSEHVKIGELLNILSSKHGYEVEMISTTTSELGFFLLSRKTTPVDNDAVQHIKVDDDVKEVARYNLQGLPVRKNEKGIQIIVYSNYTTKTVIVE